MVLRRFCLFSLFIITILVANAQNTIDANSVESDDIFSSIQDETYGGSISLYQDPSLHVLIDKYSRINKKQGLRGYRIQIYSGSGTAARTEANEVRFRLQELFPEFDPSLIYFNYQAPYFKVVIGDFRNKNEAFEVYHDIKKKFSGSYIVKTRINYPKLTSN